MTPANSWTQIRFEDRPLIVVASHPADLLTALRKTKRARRVELKATHERTAPNV